MTSPRALDQVLDNLEHVTVELDEDFHRLLESEKQVETELKDEMQEDEQLMEVTNKGLQVVEQLEKVEEKVEQHEKAAKKEGISHEDMAEILGHTIEEVSQDVQHLQKVIRIVKKELEDFEEDSDKTSQEIHNYEDIVNHMAEGEQKMEELEKRLEELANSEYSQA